MEIVASGRDVEKVGALEGNTMLETYRELAPTGPNLTLVVKNGIPLGMGCGSSAAALVAGVELANHFGGLGMTRDEVLAEACRREGHPDNVAACLLGGFTVSAMVDGGVQTATFVGGEDWRLISGDAKEFSGHDGGEGAAAGELPEGGCRCKSSGDGPAGGGVCAGPARAAGAGDAGPGAPAVPDGGLWIAAAAAAAGGTRRSVLGDPVGCGSVGSDHRESSGIDRSPAASCHDSLRRFFGRSC